MKKVLLSLMAASLVLTACEDEFTEKDLLEAQQSVAYSVRLVDVTQDEFSEEFGVEGVTVTLTQGGTVYTATTNADGFALFPQVKLGNGYFSVKSDNYYSVKGNFMIDADGRIGQVSGGTISLLPKEGENVGTVEGYVEIDLDETTPGMDTLKSGTIEFQYGENHEPIVATIDDQGKFSVKLPAGIRFNIYAATLLLDQTRSVYNGSTGAYENQQVPTRFYYEGNGRDVFLINGETQTLNYNYEYYY